MRSSPARSDPSPSPMVGRLGETRVLARVVDELARRRPSVVHVVAAPGLGKTRLISQICEDAANRGMLVLRGTADERGRGRLFAAVAGPFLDEIGISVDADLVSAIGVESKADGSLGARGVANLLRRALATLASRRGVVLALDDVHWADEGSIDVLAALSRRPPDTGVAIVLGYRPMPGLEALHDVRPGRLEGVVPGMFYRLEPAELTAAEVAALVPGLPASRLQVLVEVSGGNPFYVESLRGRVARLPTHSLVDDALPEPVRGALLAELRALDSSARSVVDVASVVGEPFDPALVADVSGAGFEHVLAILDQARALHICALDPSGRWRFRHPLLARVTYDAQPTSVRLAIHRRVSDELARRGALPQQRARHVAAAGAAGDVEDAEILLAAADRLAEQAPRQAERWYAAALAIAPDGGSRDVRTIELARARVLGSIGQLAEARRIVHALLAGLPPADPRRADACALAARVDHLMGHNAESAALLIRELAAASMMPDRSACALYLELATTRLLGGAFDAAREAAESAQHLVENDDHALVAYSSAVIALSAAAGGDIDLALNQRAAAAFAVDAMTDAELTTALEAGIWLGWAEMFIERLTDARRHLERCLTIARRGAHHHLLAHLMIGYGSVLKTLGELPAASAAYDDAADAAAQIESSELDTMTAAMQCRIATWLGDLDAAESFGARAVEASADRDNWFAAVAAAVLAQARVMGGRAEGCVDAIYDAGGGRDLRGFDPASRCDWLEVVVRAAVLDGDLVVATDAAERATACAAALGLEAPQGYAALAAAEVALARQDPTDAIVLAGEAVLSFASAGYRLDEARAILVRATALAAAARRTEAITNAVRAESIFAAAGARLLQTQARRMLRSLGKRVAAGPAAAPAATDGPLASLSRREREVAALVARGRTNRQIASTLFVSEKTVESHLGHIFTKLDVTSRAAVAALAGRASQS